MWKEKIDRARSSSLYITLLTSTYIKLTRNLEGAIKIGAGLMNNVLTQELSKVIWEIETKREFDIRKAIEKRKEIINRIDPYFSYVLELLSSSLNEVKEKFSRSIDKAVDFHMNAVEKMMIKFVETAINPIKIIFSFLVLLPVILIALMPIATLIVESPHAGIDLLFIVDIIIPLIVFIALTDVISKRPMALLETYSKRMELKKENAYILIIGFIIALASLLLPYPFSLPVSISMSSMSLILFLNSSIKEHKEKTKSVEEVLNEMPILLKEIGVSLRRGEPLESSLKYLLKTENLNKSTSRFIGLIYNWISIKGKSLKSFTNIIDKEFPSNILRDIFAVLSIAVERGTEEAGEVIERLSEYIERMERLERRMSELLEEVTSSLSLMASITIPLIAAISLSFALVVLEYITSINISNNIIIDLKKVSITPNEVSLIISLYAVEMIMLSSAFNAILKHGRNKIKIIEEISNKSIQGIIIYIVSFILTYMLLKSVIGGVL